MTVEITSNNLIIANKINAKNIIQPNKIDTKSQMNMSLLLPEYKKSTKRLFSAQIGRTVGAPAFLDPL